MSEVGDPSQMGATRESRDPRESPQAPATHAPHPRARVYLRVAQDLHAGARAAIGGHLDAPPHDAHAHRLAHAAALPFTVLRILLRDPAARRAYLEVLVIELAFAVPLAIACATHSDEVEEAMADGGHTTFATIVAGFAALFAALSIIEWCVVALAHEHHDALGVRASQLTGTSYETMDGPPRVRLDFDWLRTKMKRKLRGVIVVACGLPLLAVSAGIPHLGDWIYAALTSAWTAYWFAVFALGGTFLAWEPEAAPDPWFVRACERAGRVPVIGAPMRLYARFCRRLTRSVRAACAAFEEAPWEAAGLALARAIGGLPIVYLALRPVFGVAATHALEGMRRVKSNALPALPPDR
jgi:hypothetical protein